MYRDYIIFSGVGSGSGYVRIESAGKGLRVAVALKGFRALKKDEVFKAFLVEKEKADTPFLLGSLDGGKGVFNVPGNICYDAVVVARKNVNTGEMTNEFWGFKKGHEFELGGLAIKEGDWAPQGAGEQSGGEIKPQAASVKGAAVAEPEAPSQAAEDKAPPQAEEKSQSKNEEENNLKSETKFKISSILKTYGGGGFTWQRINGYFSMFNYSIVQYILSNPLVQSAILRWGYYLSGVKEDGDCIYIALVIPVPDNGPNPFSHVGEFSSVIAQNRDTAYYAVCVGVDKTGEFFCKVE